MKITAFYMIAALVVGVVATRAPWVAKYLPVGTAERLFSPPSGQSLAEAVEGKAASTTSTEGRSMGQSVGYLVLCFVAAHFVAFPLVEVYRGTVRAGKKIDPSSIKMILLLPISVTGLVLIVQNSLALAFGLAGLIAGAGVRFRTRVKQLSDTLFFMVAIGIGLASGVGALGIAVMMSMVFCYASLLIQWRQNSLVPSGGTADDEKGG